MPELTSTTLVQNWLGDSSIPAATLSPYINLAEASIARYCNRYDDKAGAHWLTSSREEYIQGEFSTHVIVKFTPVTAIASVEIMTSATSSQTLTTTNFSCDGIPFASLAQANPGTAGQIAFFSGLLNAPAAWDAGYTPIYYPSIGVPYSPNFAGGQKRVRVTYTGGYWTSGTGSQLPGDLIHAATVLAGIWYQRRMRDPSLRSQTLGEFSETYAQATSDPLKGTDLEGILNAYRRTTY
jgi:hypothetical protein